MKELEEISGEGILENLIHEKNEEIEKQGQYIKKLSEQIKALRMACYQYQNKIDNLLYVEKAVNRKVDSLSSSISKMLGRKCSGQYFVFDYDEKEKRFHSPLIVDADCPEEAL